MSKLQRHTTKKAEASNGARVGGQRKAIAGSSQALELAAAKKEAAALQKWQSASERKSFVVVGETL